MVYIPFDENGDPTSDQPIDLLAHEPPNAQWEDDFRPVDVDFDGCGGLLVTGDNTGSKLVRIQYIAAKDETIPQTPTPPTPNDNTCSELFSDCIVDEDCCDGGICVVRMLGPPIVKVCSSQFVRQRAKQTVGDNDRGGAAGDAKIGSLP